MDQLGVAGEAVRARRDELRLTQDAIDGISSAWLRHLEHGRARNPQQSKIQALERALFWAPGSYELILKGGQPAAMPPPAAEPAEEDVSPIGSAKFAVDELRHNMQSVSERLDRISRREMSVSDRRMFLIVIQTLIEGVDELRPNLVVFADRSHDLLRD